MVFYMSDNGAILTHGIEGFVPTSCILRVRQLPNYKAMRSAMSKQWGSTSAPVIGRGFREKGHK